MLKHATVLSLFLLTIAGTVNAESHDAYARSKFPFYAGLTAGYGSTTWGQLVPSKENKNLALSFSTPIHVNEGGGIVGVFVGYEFIPFFALEASYTHYPRAKIFFDPTSLFSFEHDNLTELTSDTEQIALIGKFMLPIPHTRLRAYSSVGAAGVHRSDEISDAWGLHPTFGVGFNYHFTDHLMAEIGIDYTAGYGESELSPVEHYVPFLYSSYFRIAYRF